MGQIGTIIGQSAAHVTTYAQRIMNGVTNETFARLARPGGVEVKSNHPAFVFGHLSLYPARVMTHVGKPHGAAAIPAGWDELFRNGVECRDDPQRTIYPAMDTLMSFYYASYKTAISAIGEAPDALLAGPNPMEGRMREMFPALGAMLTFYLTGHTQVHMGQISAWRRMMGLPAA